MRHEQDTLGKRTQFARREALFPPGSLEKMSCDRSMFYETPEEIAAGLEWGRRKAELLHWIRRQMGRRLTRRERRCVELHFFAGKTYQEVGEFTGTNASSAHRAISRAMRKLRQAVRQDARILRRKRMPKMASAKCEVRSGERAGKATPPPETDPQE